MPAAVIELEELPVTDRIEVLREHMLGAPVPLALDPHKGANLAVRSRVADLGSIHLLSTRASGGDVVRTPDLARDSTPPSLMVTVIDQGITVVVRGDETTTLNAGDIGLYLTTEPYRLRFSDGAHRHTFQLRLDQLGLPEPLIRSQLPNSIRPDNPTQAAVSAFLRSAGRTAPGAPSSTLSELQQPTLELVRFLLTRAATETTAGREAAARSLATRIDEYVQAHLDDPELSARTIAEAFTISARYVYTILARRGIDLGDAIRERRLERAAGMLEDPRYGLWTIADIAHRCGFSDHAHFSRAFRARFGVPPSGWRHNADTARG